MFTSMLSALRTTNTANLSHGIDHFFRITHDEACRAGLHNLRYGAVAKRDNRASACHRLYKYEPKRLSPHDGRQHADRFAHKAVAFILIYFTDPSYPFR